MAVSEQFLKALEVYRLEKKYGNRRQNQRRLAGFLKSLLYQNCQRLWPNLEADNVWRLKNGSLAIILPQPRKPLRQIYDSEYWWRNEPDLMDGLLIKAVLNGQVLLAPVKAAPQGFWQPPIRAVSPGTMRRLRNVSKLYFQGKKFYAELKAERMAPLEELDKFLGKAIIERWRIPKYKTH